MVKIYNKLVRDKMPEIIEAEGNEYKVRILSGREFATELLNKLREETEELIKAKDNQPELIKEIGDVYEVLEVIINYYKIDREEIMRLKEEKKLKRGGFNKRIFLESVNK